MLKSKLNGKNKIKAIITRAVSVLMYGAGILRWTKEELTTGVTMNWEAQHESVEQLMAMRKRTKMRIIMTIIIRRMGNLMVNH